MQYSEFTSIISLLTGQIGEIFSIMDSVNIISSPAISILDFVLSMIIVTEAFEFIMFLTEE